MCPSKNLRGKPYPDQLIHAMKVLEIKKKQYVGDNMIKYQQKVDKVYAFGIWMVREK